MTVETTAYAAMLRRMIRAYGRRVGQESDADLAEMVAMREELEKAIAEAVSGQRTQGQSWAYIGRGLGCSRQSAWERYGSVTKPVDGSLRPTA